MVPTPHLLGHALGLSRDSSKVRARDHVPAGLDLPRGGGDGRGEHLRRRHALGAGFELGFRRGQVRGEIGVIAGRIDPDVAVRPDGRDGGAAGRRVARSVAGFRLALVRRVGGDVDQPGDVRVGPRLGDDRAPVAVADEDRRAVLLVEDASGGRDVVGQPGQRLLDDARLRMS